MAKNQFSNDKIFFYPERLKQVLSGDIVTPIVYELSLSGNCNCACQYCCCKNFHSNASLTREQIDLIVKEIANNHGEAVTLTGGGEPLTNPDFSYCIRQFASKNISVGIITNGLLLSDDTIDAIARHASFCRISLDTVNENQYYFLRGVPLHLSSLRERIAQLVNERDLLGNQLLLGAQIVYCNQTDKDIIQTVTFCRECHLDFLQIRPLDNITGETLIPQYEFYQSKRPFLREIRDRYSTNEFSLIINENKFEEYDDQSVGKLYHHCLGGNFTAAIGHDMKVYFCCANIGNPELCIGNLATEPLHDILMSAQRQTLIEHPKWSFCQQQCRNHKINKILQELSQLPYEQTKQLLLQKQEKERPLHCEFL